MITASAEWSVQAGERIRAQLNRWGALSAEHQGQVSRLISLMERQEIDLAELPQWLLSVEGCEAQIKLYQNFLSVYEEVKSSPEEAR